MRLIKQGGSGMFAKFAFIISFIITLCPILLSKDFDKNNFYKSIKNSDAIFVASFIKGGKTKIKVKLIRNIVGEMDKEFIIYNIDHLKYRQRFRPAPLRSGSKYVFFTKFKNGKLVPDPDSLIIPVLKKSVNFSIAAPYVQSFWQYLDSELFDTAVKSIREKFQNNLSESNITIIKNSLEKYSNNNDTTSLKALIDLAALVGVQLNQERYLSLIRDDSTLGCIAIKNSVKIFGKHFYDKHIHSILPDFEGDNQVAAIYATIDADNRKSVPLLAKILKMHEPHYPPSSECFPVNEPTSNREMLIRAIIEIDSKESKQILAKELDRSDYEWLKEILKILKEYEGDDLIEIALLSASKEQISQRKLEYLEYLTLIKSEVSSNALKNLFNKRDELYWKKIILSTLGKYKYEENLPFFIKALQEDPNQEIRISAAIAIGTLGAPDGSKPLYDFIVRERSILAKTVGIDSIAAIKSNKVVPYLKEIVKKSENKKIREEATTAIEENLFLLRYGHKREK